MYKNIIKNNGFGCLKYLPSFKNESHNDEDSPIPSEWFGNYFNPEREFSDANQEVLLDQLLLFQPKTILEIGVQRNSIELSSTGVFFKHKNPDTIYIGVDIEDKSHLNDISKNIYTLKIDSANYDVVYSLAHLLNVDEFDLIFIDGFHSINRVVKEFKYIEKLSERGVVVMHDTNWHPGPTTVFDSVDETKYCKQKFCTGPDDNGIAIFFQTK